MVEQGVRFIELIDTGSSHNWDAHDDIHKHAPLAKNIDKPIAGLLADLKSRGLLKDTLVVFTTEFGRSPTPEGAMGRGHYNRAYASWLAGGGIKGGIAYGSTDSDGTSVKDNPVSVGDLFATVYKGMGLDPALQIRDNLGRPMKIAEGNPIKELV
jgi:uncharacterized protein (DUF1501 family)